MRVIELLMLGLFEVAALSFLVYSAGKVHTLMCAALLPVAAWCYAYLRARKYTWAIVGAALGLAAYPFSYGLSALMFLPFPYQLLGVPGFFGQIFHGTPGILMTTFISTDNHAHKTLVAFLVDYLLNGLVWAMLYGRIGARFDCNRREPK